TLEIIKTITENCINNMLNDRATITRCYRKLNQGPTEEPLFFFIADDADGLPKKFDNYPEIKKKLPDFHNLIQRQTRTKFPAAQMRSKFPQIGNPLLQLQQKRVESEEPDSRM